jgi:hypothetical protein
LTDKEFDGEITRFCACIRILSGIFPAFPVSGRDDVRLLIWPAVVARTVETLLRLVADPQQAARRMGYRAADRRRTSVEDLSPAFGPLSARR